jgi:predicted ATPase
MGYSLFMLGGFVEARKHLDEAIAHYDRAKHAPLATRFGQDAEVTILSTRSWVLWNLGYPEAALTDADRALKSARAIGHTATSIFAFAHASYTHLNCGSSATAIELVDELIDLADEKNVLFWKKLGLLLRGSLFALTGKFSDAVQLLTSTIKAYRETGATMFLPLHLCRLAIADAELGLFSEAWRCIGEATSSMETTQETVAEAELNCVAGKIALKSPERDDAKAEALSVPSPLPVNNKPNPGNSALP